MKNTFLRIFIFSFIFPLLLLFAFSAHTQTNVLTQHNNLMRTGWNNAETILNANNVAPGSFGKLFSRTVDDQIYAQILIMENVNIPVYGLKNLSFIATVNNTVYAFDADDATVTTPYWQVNLTATGLRPPKNSDETGACGSNYKDFSGNMGIVGTPVIDPVTNTLYVVARSTVSSTSGFVQYLHALDITTGTERPNSPKLITAQVTGSGAGSSGGIITFNPQHQNQRSGLLLLNGIVYITYASHCDWAPYHGWVLGYDETTLSQTNVYNNTPDGYNGGIWMSGGAPAADAAGNIYLASGNGTAGYGGDLNNTRDRSESAVKLIPSGSGFTTSTFFTPQNYTTLEGGDLDFGVSQMMLLPNTNQVMTSCKDGHIYLLDRDNMGGYNSGTNAVAQTINLGSNAHLHSSLTYYHGAQKEYAYSWSENTLLKAFPYNHTTNTFDLANTINGNVAGPTGNSGAVLSVSSNGSIDSSAILWACYSISGDANQAVRTGILRAFSATDITKELWNSSIASADNPGNYAKFNNPTIANGKVYLATFSNKFIVYGLTGQQPDLCSSDDIALNQPAFASSSENATNTPDKVVDGDATTRWASLSGSDPQYIYVDLGKEYTICRAVLQWEAALGKDFTIDVSDDAVNWTTAATITGNINFSNYISLSGSKARYVRMNGTARGTTFGYSLYSFEVYGIPFSDCATPDSLTTSDIYENTATLHWNSTGAGHYNIQYKTVTATNFTTVTSDTTMITLADLACGTDYLFKVQSACSPTDTSNYSSASSFSQLDCGSNCNPLPTRWTTLDIGNTGIDGSACYNPDTYTLNGSGNDIGGTEDAFRFALKTLEGDGEFNARVATLDNANPFNKIGIMVRETLSPGSKFAFVALTSGNGAVFETRSNTDGSTTTLNSPPSIVAPYWIKLIKTASLYNALVSQDGVNYINFGTIDVGFGNGDPVYAGIAITSHDNTMLSTGTIDNYSFTDGVLPVKLLSFTGSQNLQHKIDLKWLATQDMNTSYFVIERSKDDKNFAAIDSVKAIGSGAYTITYNTTDNDSYRGINFYRLKIVDKDGHISYSAMIMVRISNSSSPLVYPNPATMQINVAQGTDPIKSITIYDVTGKTLKRMIINSFSNVISIATSNLIKGNYILEITTTGSIYRDKIIIQ